MMSIYLNTKTRYWLLCQCLVLVFNISAQKSNNYINLDFTRALTLNPININLSEKYNDITDSSVLYIDDYYGDTVFLNKRNINNMTLEKLKIYIGIHYRYLVNISFTNEYLTFLFKTKVLVFENSKGYKLIKKMNVPRKYNYYKIKCVNRNVFLYYYTSRNYKKAKAKVVLNDIGSKKNYFTPFFEQPNKHSSPSSIYRNHNYIELSDELFIFSKIHDYNIVIKNIDFNTFDTLRRDVFKKSDIFYKQLKYAYDKYSLYSTIKNYDHLCSFIEKDIIMNIQMIGKNTLYVQYLKGELPCFDIWKKRKKWELIVKEKSPFRVNGVIKPNNYPVWNGYEIKHNNKGYVMMYKSNYVPILNLDTKIAFSEEYYSKKGSPAFLLYKYIEVSR